MAIDFAGAKEIYNKEQKDTVGVGVELACNVD